jgi:hypothetical protein
MPQILKLVHEQAIPFFESTDSPDGLLKCLKAQDWGSRHHLEFEIACCLAKLGRTRESEKHAIRAAILYHKDGRPWAIESAKLADLLLASIHYGSVEDLLNLWTEHSVERLRIDLHS